MEYGWLLAIGNLVLALIGGGIAGALVTHYLQNRGGISLQASRWEPYGERGQTLVYHFDIVVYNETALPDGLFDCRVVFSRNGKELFVSRPKQENPEGAHKFIFEGESIPYRPRLEVVALPPRTPVYVEVRGLVEDADTEKAYDSDKVEFVARSPSKGEIKGEVPTGSAKPFPADNSA